MNKSKIVVASISLSLLSLMLISKPVLMRFGQLTTLGDAPSLFVYLLVVWLIIIAGSYFIFDRQSDSKSK
ncbi:MAG: hypothetical protein AAFO69_06935 [Bacteroidota bacterium]